MPPSARRYGPVAYTKPPQAKIKRSSSVGLSELTSRMDSVDLNLLSESISLSDFSSNHSDSLEAVPPFPNRRRPVVIDYINLHSNILCSQGIVSTGESSALSEHGKIITTGPTPPRLKAMLREVVNVRKWRVRLTVCHVSPL